MIRNLSLSLILSVAITFIGIVLYIFHPILKLMLGQFFNSGSSSNAQSAGITTVAGGVSATVFPIALVIAVVLFFVIFHLLQRRTQKKRG